MCHNGQSVVFNEHLLGPMSPGCLLECGAGRLAGRWKSAAGSHVKPACPVTEWPRAAQRALRPPIPGRQKITRPSSSIGAGGERIPKVVLPPPAPRTPTVFFLISGRHVCCLRQYVGCGGRVPYRISASRRLLRIA